MLSAIFRAPFARPLFLSSASRLAKPAAIARPSVLLETRRSFLTTASVAATEAKTPKEKKPKTTEKVEKTEKAKTKKAVKAKKAPKVEKVKKVKKVKAEKPKKPIYFKKDLTPPQPRPRSAWQDFYIKYVQEHKKEGDVFGQHAPGASAAWRTMSAEEKAKYGASREEMEEYRKLAAEYRSTDLYKKTARKFRPRRPRDRPMAAYSLFVQENYDKTSPLSFVEQGTVMANKWHGLTAEEKDAYRQRTVEIYQKQKEEKAAAAAEAEN